MLSYILEEVISSTQEPSGVHTVRLEWHNTEQASQLVRVRLQTCQCRPSLLSHLLPVCLTSQPLPAAVVHRQQRLWTCSPNPYPLKTWRPPWLWLRPAKPSRLQLQADVELGTMRHILGCGPPCYNRPARVCSAVPAEMSGNSSLGQSRQHSR